jgi:hypothetical protein
MNNIILTTNFNTIHDTKPIKAQKAGFVDFCISNLCIYSPIKAQTKGHKINPKGKKNIHIIIPKIHHRFHRLVHQNFLVHSIGK